MLHLDHNAIARSLTNAGVHAEIRGNGAARFVFAEANQRAVEISASDAGVWVEYWDGGDDPKFDRMFPNAEAAMADARAWLANKAG